MERSDTAAPGRCSVTSPGYPDELVDEVVTYAGRPVCTALEIGAGTGKATRMFARRGISVTATDPDAAMLTELRKHVPATVAREQGARSRICRGWCDLVYWSGDPTSDPLDEAPGWNDWLDLAGLERVLDRFERLLRGGE